MATTRFGPVRLVGRLMQGMRPWLVAGVVVGTFLPPLVAAQNPAPGAVPAISVTTEIQAVPSERSSPVRIYPVEEE